MIEDLLEIGGPTLLIPIMVVVIGTALVKGIFGVHRSKTADRRDFLDLWSRQDLQDDMWLEVAVRHLCGEYLPASLIRSLLTSPQVGRAILEISDSWNLLEMDDETKELCWKKKRHQKANARRDEIALFQIVYFIFMGTALVIVYATLTADLGVFPLWMGWFYAFFLGGVALRCLAKSEALKTASEAVPRWLGLS